MINMLINPILGILSQCMRILNHHSVHFKHLTILAIMPLHSWKHKVQSYKNNAKDRRSHLTPSFCIPKSRLYPSQSRSTKHCHLCDVIGRTLLKSTCPMCHNVSHIHPPGGALFLLLPVLKCLTGEVLTRSQTIKLGVLSLETPSQKDPDWQLFHNTQPSFLLIWGCSSEELKMFWRHYLPNLHCWLNREQVLWTLFYLQPT